MALIVAGRQAECNSVRVTALTNGAKPLRARHAPARRRFSVWTLNRATPGPCHLLLDQALPRVRRWGRSTTTAKKDSYCENDQLRAHSIHFSLSRAT